MPAARVFDAGKLETRVSRPTIASDDIRIGIETMRLGDRKLIGDVFTVVIHVLRRQLPGNRWIGADRRAIGGAGGPA